MQTVTKYKVKSLVGRHEIHTTLPNGKKLSFDFTGDEQGGFYATIPEVVEYKDDFGNTRLFHDNYAAFVLSAYPGQFQAVEKIEQEVVKVNPVQIVPEDEATDLLKEAE